MSKETQTDTVSTADAVELFRHNQDTIGELVGKIQSIDSQTIMDDKKAKIASFRGQILNMDLENQVARINFLQEFIKTIC